MRPGDAWPASRRRVRARLRRPGHRRPAGVSRNGLPPRPPPGRLATGPLVRDHQHRDRRSDRPRAERRSWAPYCATPTRPCTGRRTSAETAGRPSTDAEQSTVVGRGPAARAVPAARLYASRHAAERRGISGAEARLRWRHPSRGLLTHLLTLRGSACHPDRECPVGIAAVGVRPHLGPRGLSRLRTPSATGLARPCPAAGALPPALRSLTGMLSIAGLAPTPTSSLGVRSASTLCTAPPDLAAPPSLSGSTASCRLHRTSTTRSPRPTRAHRSNRPTQPQPRHRSHRRRHRNPGPGPDPRPVRLRLRPGVLLQRPAAGGRDDQPDRPQLARLG